MCRRRARTLIGSTTAGSSAAAAVIALSLVLAGHAFAAQSAAPPVPMIEREQAFRYWRTLLREHYGNPVLSPDEKWLVYRRNDPDRDFEHFYTRLGRQDAIPLPLAGPGEKAPDPNFIHAAGWSPDGKMLALTSSGDSCSIVIVAFDDDGARHLETNPADEYPTVQWDDEGAFTFVDATGSLVRKHPGKDAQILDLAPAGKDRRTSFQRSGPVIVVSVQNPRYGRLRTVRKEIRPAKTPSSLPLFTAASDTEHCLELLPSEDGKFLYLREDWNVARVLELKSGREIARLGRCEKVEWSPSAPLLACTEYRAGRELGPNGKERITATHGFMVVNAERGETKDCGFAIGGDTYRWTPDGRHIVFADRYEDKYHRTMLPGIFVMRAGDCGLLPRISRHGGETPSSPQISPSGKLILWQSYELGTFFAVPNPLAPELFRADPGSPRP